MGENKRIAIVIQYLGTKFHGWQRQPNQRTVQEEIEKAIAMIHQKPATLHGAGRTDTGVHAAAQVAHFDSSTNIPPQNWAAVLNTKLPKDILIRGSAEVDKQWHARFSALWRRYRYTIYTGKPPNLFLEPFTWHYYQETLEESLMENALKPLVGRHHLAAFCRAGSVRKDAWVEVQAVQCIREGQLIYIEIQANGFLYGMVRLLVGMLVQVGTKKLSQESFQQIWVQQQREQVKHSAPAKGLCLLRVGYPEFPLPEELWFDSQPQFILR